MEQGSGGNLLVTYTWKWSSEWPGLSSRYGNSGRLTSGQRDDQLPHLVRGRAEGDIPRNIEGRETRTRTTQPIPVADSRWYGWRRLGSRRVVSKSWLAHSDWPLDWGWNSEDRLANDQMSVQNAFQNRDESCGPQSETMYTRSPWIRKTCCTINWGVSLAEGSLGRGMKWAALEN
jgi:hypothetical protein